MMRISDSPTKSNISFPKEDLQNRSYRSALSRSPERNEAYAQRNVNVKPLRKNDSPMRDSLGAYST
jgi:hypothetical protein